MKKIILCALLISACMSCGEGNKKEFFYLAKQQGKLDMQIAITEWCLENNVGVDMEAIEANYYKRCPDCK